MMISTALFSTHSDKFGGLFRRPKCVRGRNHGARIRGKICGSLRPLIRSTPGPHGTSTSPPHRIRGRPLAAASHGRNGGRRGGGRGGARPSMLVQLGHWNRCPQLRHKRQRRIAPAIEEQQALLAAFEPFLQRLEQSRCDPCAVVQGGSMRQVDCLDLWAVWQRQIARGWRAPYTVRWQPYGALSSAGVAACQHHWKAFKPSRASPRHRAHDSARHLPV
jgi:hypothetical protein